VLGLTERGVHIVFVKENLNLHPRGFAHVDLLRSVMGAFAQFERELIRERQRGGIAIAKREGKYTGRKPSLSPTRVAELRRRAERLHNERFIVRAVGCQTWATPRLRWVGFQLV
jgi:DNA invertase Pin-like site-specific DNA recombinase